MIESKFETGEFFNKELKGIKGKIMDELMYVYASNFASLIKRYDGDFETVNTMASSIIAMFCRECLIMAFMPLVRSKERNKFDFDSLKLSIHAFFDNITDEVMDKLMHSTKIKENLC